ncbi:hypothetical protein AB0C42_24145 [Micromonospora taraxaci]|uniref:hypothetical protein n=1 Tax=Micromonospora taraxaci TaxID=1316803 RepID=UPI0033D5647D
MSMIPDAGPPAQPADVWRVDVFTSETETGSVYFNATEAEVDAEALRIVTAQGGDHGDIYQLTGADRAVYYTTVSVK